MSRFLLKLSGEALAGEKKTGFEESVVRGVAKQIKELLDAGHELALVIGGGNFWRGRSSDAFDRSKADQIGMLATVMNAIYVSEICRTEGMDTVVFTPFAVGSFTEVYGRDTAEQALREKKLVFFAGGTGHPYFSTDTATLLRAIEIEADEVLLAKAIDGVYDKDPGKNPDAKKYETVSISEVVEKGLGVVDAAAAVMAKEYAVPMLVFALAEENAIVRAARGEVNGTKVTV